MEDCAKDTVKSAEKMEEKYLEQLENVPVAGQIAGVIECAVDEEKGLEMLDKANRNTCVMAAGAVATLATENPVAGFAAGMAAGAAYDGLESTAEGKPCGEIKAWKGVSEGKMECLFEAIATPIEDGMAGESGGEFASEASKMVSKHAGESIKDTLKGATADFIEENKGKILKDAVVE